MSEPESHPVESRAMKGGGAMKLKRKFMQDTTARKLEGRSLWDEIIT